VNTRAQSGEGIVSRSPPTPTSVPPAMAACSSSVLGTSIAGVMTASLRIPAFLSIRRGPWAMWESSFCCKLVLQPSDRAPSIRFGDISARFLDRLIYSVAIQSATSTQGTVLGCRSGAEQAGRSHLRQTTLLSPIFVFSDLFRNRFVVFAGQKSRGECPFSSPEDASCKLQLLAQACRLARSGVGHGSEAWALRRQLAPLYVRGEPGLHTGSAN
jgi:hypothetical protein